MAGSTRYGSIKRFGPRYGRRVKYKVGKIEEEGRLSNTCPYCQKKKVKRIAAGIYECAKCNSKFTGRAYTVGKTAVGVKVEQEMAEPEEEDMDVEDPEEEDMDIEEPVLAKEEPEVVEAENDRV